MSTYKDRTVGQANYTMSDYRKDMSMPKFAKGNYVKVIGEYVKARIINAKGTVLGYVFDTVVLVELEFGYEKEIVNIQEDDLDFAYAHPE